MDGLKTSRVIVIDDEPKEGMALLRALAKAGIGASYFSGDFAEYPSRENRMRGVRLLALDMDLGTGQNEDDRVLDPLLAAVDAVVAGDNGPFILLGWTERPELVSRFQELLLSRREDLVPNLVFSIRKSDVKDEQGEYLIGQIANKLVDATTKWSPFDLLLAWEQRVHDAATDTTNALTNIGRPVVPESNATQQEVAVTRQDDGLWKDGLLQVLAALARASAGSTLSDGSGAFQALVETLSTVHLDQLQTQSTATNTLPKKADALVARSSELPVDIRSRVNSMLLLGPVSNGLRPGQIYFETGWHNASTFPIGTSRDIKAGSLIFEGFDTPKDEEPEAFKTRMLTLCVPVLVEITAGCDHAQNKAPYRRLVAALLVPENGRSYIKPSGLYLKSVGPVYMDSAGNCPAAGNYVILLNARYLLTLRQAELKKHRAGARLREQVAIDIQAWFAGHAARPGYASV